MSGERSKENEGVIRFCYELEPAQMTDEIPSDLLAILNHWRQRMVTEKVIGGGEPDRYNGLGYGNLSARLGAAQPEFVISASQTGAMKALEASDYALIRQVDLENFSVQARGSRPPSSETLTHAMIYQRDPAVNIVLHAHGPVLWQQAAVMRLPVTPPEVGYGSPEMARCVTELMGQSDQRPNLFITLGHQDGVFVYGPDAEKTGAYLLQMLARAEELCRAADSHSGKGATH